jgi:hypothetical protein
MAMIEPLPDGITRREFRNESGGVERGEAVAAFASAPAIDPDRLRADLDNAVDQDPFGREW